MTIRNSSQQPSLDEARNVFDLEAFLALLSVGRKTIVLSTAAAVVAALAYGFLSPSVYESKAKVLAEPPRENNPALIEARSFQERRAFIETQKELVVGDSVLRQAIVAIRKNEKDPATAVRKVTAEEIKNVSPDDVEEFASHVFVSDRADLGRAAFTTGGIGESNAFFIGVRQNDAEEAAKSANILVQSYLLATARVRRDQADSSFKGLSLAVVDAEKDTKEAHDALVKFEADAGPLLPELMNIDKPTLRVYPEIEELRAQYEAASVAISEKKALIEAVKKGLKEDGIPVIPNEVIRENQSLQMLRDQKAQLQLQLIEKEPFFTDDSREIQSIKQKVNAGGKQVREEINRLLAGEEQSLSILEAAQATRSASLKNYDNRLIELSRMNSQHSELKRNYLSRAAALDVQMQSSTAAQAARAQSADASANIAIIDEAVADFRAVAPHTWRALLLSIPLGAAAGILIVLLGYLTRPIFLHPRQAAAAVDLPVVGVLRAKD